jgi:hypothetical protein
MQKRNDEGVFEEALPAASEISIDWLRPISTEACSSRSLIGCWEE